MYKIDGSDKNREINEGEVVGFHGNGNLVFGGGKIDGSRLV